MFSLVGFAAFLIEAEHHVHEANHKALEEAAVILETKAKSYPGHYQAGWASLKPETIARKATGDSPLLESGAMRDSITHNSDADEAYIGSDDMKLVYQEFGTSRGIPPRPVLGTAVVQGQDEVEETIGREFMAAIGLG